MARNLARRNNVRVQKGDICEKSHGRDLTHSFLLS